MPTSITRSWAGVVSVWTTLRLSPSTSTYSTRRPSFPSDRTFSFPLSSRAFSRRIVLNGTGLLTISKLGSVKTRFLTPSSGDEEVIGFSGWAGFSGCTGFSGWVGFFGSAGFSGWTWAASSLLICSRADSSALLTSSWVLASWIAAIAWFASSINFFLASLLEPSSPTFFSMASVKLAMALLYSISGCFGSAGCSGLEGSSGCSGCSGLGSSWPLW